MKQIKIISQNPINRFDGATLCIHLLVVLIMWIAHQKHLLSTNALKDLISGYFFILPLALVGLFFRSLRNFNIYLIWLFIAVVQLLVYPTLHELPGYQYYRGSAFTPLRSLLPTLIAYQLLRIIFIKIYNMDMIISINRFRGSRWEDQENRNITWLEVVFSVSLALIAIFSNIYD